MLAQGDIAPPALADDLIDMDRFGLESVRTVADYEKFAAVDFKLRWYAGYEIVSDFVPVLRQRFSDRSSCFFKQSDSVMATLPAADAIPRRDCLTHLPLDGAMMALQRFKQSGARYLLATTHATGRTVWVASGAWYAIDLTASPFKFPASMQLLVDNETGAKRLGVWSLQDLPV